MTSWRTRTVGVLGVTWGTILFVGGSRLFALTAGRAPTSVEESALIVLGLRHVAGGALQIGVPLRGHRVLLAVDLTHAASMIALATQSPRHRRAAVVSGGSAVGYAMLALLAGQRDHDELGVRR
jgi:hypothetical protein